MVIIPGPGEFLTDRVWLSTVVGGGGWRLTDLVDEHAGPCGVDAPLAALVCAGLSDEHPAVGHDAAGETLVQQHVPPLGVRVHDVTLVPRAQTPVLALCGGERHGRRSASCPDCPPAGCSWDKSYRDRQRLTVAGYGPLADLRQFRRRRCE